MLDLTDDLQVLTATLYGEARGEPVEGQKAVASVILNRAKYVKTHHYPMFGDGTIKGACLFPWQFSSWNQKDPNRAKMLSLNLVMPDTVTSGLMDIAEDALAGSLPDNTGGATYYFADGIPKPSWANTMRFCLKIGHQSFYSNDTMEHPTL